MAKRKMDSYRKRLQLKRDSIVGTIERYVHDGRETDQDVPRDPADIASNSFIKELLFSQSTNDRYVLKLIDEALERMGEGQYGLCVSCGNPIQEKRLKVVPWARHCISCQELQERGLLRE
ncbi:MAG: TraR/DksA family transcriptional regulator [Acidobacteria bacterium]|nr:TraR/DksA family transcriptional regulator [Acidobacteriota bacterium]